MTDLAGKVALVTGASSGIGECFARRLAERKANLVITARRTDRLEKLAEELRKAHGVEVTVIALDLGSVDAAKTLFEKTEGAGTKVDVLINNAGFGTQEYFVEIPWEKTREQMQLNIVSLTELTWRFSRAMLARNRGWILNVASIGAYMPVPCYATYGAGKAYVRNFTEAFAYEMRRTPLRICCLCPGATSTEFMQVAGHDLPAFYRLAFMSADRCARIGLSAVLGWRRNVVAGWLNKLTMFWLRFQPRWLIVLFAAMVMQKEGAPKQLRAGTLDA
jgi:short-subunit dehydrogenase